MAIKTFTFSFKLDAKDLLEYVSERNVAVDIQAFGTGPKVKQQEIAAPATPLLLPPPGKPLARDLVLLFLVTHQQATGAELRQLLVENGFSEKTSHGLLWGLRQEGLCKSYKKGTYRATVKAIKMMEARHHGS
jgi:hypothetical protein